MSKNAVIPTLKITKPALNWFNGYLARMQTSGIVAEKVTITPARAAILLSRNPENRAIRETKVTQMVSDLTADNFQFNGEPIIIANDGSLNDGQHRLLASVKSGKSFDTIIVFGPERDSQFTIDTGSARSASDQLALQGVSNTSTAAAMARYILSFEREGTYSKRGGISMQEQINRVREDEMLLEIAAWADSRKNRMRNMLKASLAGSLFYLTAVKAPNEAKMFMEQLAIGAGLDAKSPVYLLREKLTHAPNLTEAMRVEAFVRAWNHFCQSPTTSISRLQLMGHTPDLSTPAWSINGSKASDDLVLVAKRPRRKVKA